MTYPEPYVSQLNPQTLSGQNDCWQACEAAVLLAFGKLPKTMSQAELLNTVSLATRGTPDQPGNAETNLSEAAAGLTHWSMPVNFTSDWARVIAKAWTIMLVDGVVITKADGSKPYPASFFNGASGPDHFVVSGPAYQGEYNWILNPLDPLGQWVRYDLDSVERAFSCGYWFDAVPGTKPVPPPTYMALRKFDLKATTDHLSTGIAVVPRGGTGLDWGGRRTVNGEQWGRLQFRSITGWAPIVGYIQDMA